MILTLIDSRISGLVFAGWFLLYRRDGMNFVVCYVCVCFVAGTFSFDASVILFLFVYGVAFWRFRVRYGG